MRRLYLGSLIWLFGLGLFFVLFWGDRALSQSFQLGLPVDCSSTDNCFILLYPDRDPSPEALDFECGRLTYDGHKGTDFAIPDERTMERGIPVVASAPGTVLRVRDGIPDQRLQDEGGLPPELEGQECGNGVVIEHSGGWTTQYCHLRQGSVSVQPGDRLATGDAIGLIGQSGFTSFPHVHLQVAYNNRIVDPFVGSDVEPGCQSDRQPLWAEPLSYVPTGNIRSGFATQVPTLSDLWNGKFSNTELPSNSPALLFWVQTFGVLEGDIEVVELHDPQGQIFAQNNSPIAQSQKVWMSFIGQRVSEPLAAGNWSGHYRLERNGQVLLDLEREVVLR
ncbi:MAG: M23 family metallopeptidase [Cyanobacteria bacterium P01_A01_bin.3]